MAGWEAAVAIGERLPGVTAGTWWGTPGLLVGKDSPHVIVGLDAVDEAELADLIEDAWRLTAPSRLVAAYDEAE